jgi:2-amino-4-hydroxy-6-hydroxymethyldihydropteridine diphosphokinase
MEEITVYIGIGSNVGDRLAHLQEAVDHLSRLPGSLVTGVSRIYMTEPFGDPEQNRYYNGVVALKTSLDPVTLRTHCKRIEQELGRPAQYQRCSPRTIDLDILLYGNLCLDSDILVIPHTEMHRRKFVIVPLLDLANPEHPRLHCTIADLLATCGDPSVPLRLTEKLTINSRT